MVLALSSVAMVAGCRQDGDDMELTRENEAATLAAYAATAEFPKDRNAEGNRSIAAVVTKRGSIKLMNFGETLTDADVWVNDAFVRHVDRIPGNRTITLSDEKFYNSSGQNLEDQNAIPVKIQITSDKKLYNVLGPQGE
jgi:hypothetical protein